MIHGVPEDSTEADGTDRPDDDITEAWECLGQAPAASMTIRQEYAALAAMGSASCSPTPHRIAARAFEIADALLKLETQQLQADPT